jgi:membrane protein required for colicin V production
MQAYDIFMLIVLGLAIVWGAWKGLVWQIASIMSIGLSYFVALHFRQSLAGVINASPPWNIFLSMLILFLGTGMIVWVGFNLISEAVERVKLKEFDRQLGAVFGGAKGILLCVLITLFSIALLGDPQRQAICNSKSGYYIAVLLDRADAVIPRELHDVLAPYLDRLDRSIPHPHTADQTPLTDALSEAENRLHDAARQSSGWQQELESVLEGQGKTAAPPLAPSFSTSEFSARPPEPATPYTTRRIEAHPAPPTTSGSFPR